MPATGAAVPNGAVTRRGVKEQQAREEARGAGTAVAKGADARIVDNRSVSTGRDLTESVRKASNARMAIVRPASRTAGQTRTGRTGRRGDRGGRMTGAGNG